ncbi:SH3 domain-containing protein [Helicobacter felis]|uniref:SH3 domain-containing protein n=1 Tax=Helicobacter felis TaxID=214 RepID=UPI0013153072|nr:SH3 domain-containing protein [Helicobacter felis]
MKFLVTIFIVALLCAGCLDHKPSPKPISDQAKPQKPDPTPKNLSVPNPATLPQPHTATKPNSNSKVQPNHKPLNSLAPQAHLKTSSTPKSIVIPITPLPAPQEHKVLENPVQINNYLQLAQRAYAYKDYDKAKIYYQKLADLGDARGYYGLGVVWSTYYYDDKDEDVPPDYPKALKYLQKAAHLGSAQAHIKLGDFYAEAKGVFLNPKKAIAHYQRGAELGDPQGYYKLGVLYRDGKGISQDLKKAIFYFQKAEDQGSVPAGLALGALFRDSANPLQALNHFKKAANLGSAFAHTLLGDMYANGYGVSENLKLAKEYYNKAKHTSKLLVEKEILFDPLRLPQRASYYSTKNTLPIPSPSKLKNSYLKHWYTPWKAMKVIPRKEVFWTRYSLATPGYKEDGTRHDLKVLRCIETDMDIAHYPNAHLRGVIVANTSVRAVPTTLAYYPTQRDYPSDLWQNSMIFAGTPVLITHYNKAKTYALIQSSFTIGWVRIQDVAPIRSKTIEKILHIQKYLTPLIDTMPDARMGQIFLKVPHTPNQIYTFTRNLQGFAQLTQITINPQNFTSFPRKFTTQTMAKVVDTLLGQRYGWGGINQNRDCSAFTRDSFAGFGVFLPRNSLAQVRYAHNTIDLHKMSASKKEAYIIKHATPFATILWLKGHIMLYLGTYHNQAIVAHNIWSISISKTHKPTHLYHVEKAVITTLKLGAEHKNFTEKSTFLIDRIEAMSDLYARQFH